MADNTIVQRGYDTSGRPIRATKRAWEVWDACVAELGFEPTIVQGGHLSNAAAASAATHAGDAFDIRLWDRTKTERAAMIRVFRAHAFAYWERYESQGFDLHAHMVPGPWASPSPQALGQWNAYLNGRNGLAGNGPDYHPKPNPIVLQPPEDEMAQYADQLDRIEKGIKALAADEAARHKALRKAVKQQAEATRKRLRKDGARLADIEADLDAIVALVGEDDE